jgi:hypothetical protein
MKKEIKERRLIISIRNFKAALFMKLDLIQELRKYIGMYYFFVEVK